jgi:hypothetical protein
VPMLRRLSTHVSQLHLEWRDLGCSYRSSGGLKTVLSGAWGRLRCAALPCTAARVPCMVMCLPGVDALLFVAHPGLLQRS